MNGKYQALWLNENDELEVIDQILLPHEYKTLILRSTADVVKAIKDMNIRGAGTIGCVAAFGIFIAVKEADGDDDKLSIFANQIRESRPTAVNLMWAVDRMMNRIKNSKDKTSTARDEAITLVDEESMRTINIAKFGSEIIEKISKEKNGATVNILTHCNAGWLAVVDFGTALAPIYEAVSKGIDIHVWVDETRPRNQGANLTAWELAQAGINFTIIADNTGGHLMQHGMVDMVITGADRVSRGGDVANKIGTYLKALSAKDNNIPFYVALPASTFDFNIIDGVKEIEIEERSADEVHFMHGIDSNDKPSTIRITPKNSKALNIGFDVTPSRLITGLITERGICKADQKDIEDNFFDLIK